MVTVNDTRYLERLRKISLAIAVLVGLGILAAVARYELKEKAVGTESSPLVFILSPVHARNLAPDEIRSFTSFLKSDAGLVVEVRIASSPLEALTAFQGTDAGRADAALLPLFDYTLAHHQYGVQAVLQALRGEAQAEYRGAFVVKTESPLTQPEELMGRKMAYADPFSTSGFIFPASLLAVSGITVEPVFAGDHARAVAMVVDGQADAAAVYDNAATRDTRIRILGLTSAIPNEPIFYRDRLRAETREALTASILRFASTAEGRAFFQKAADISGFQPVSDAAYAPAFEAIRSAGRRVYDVVPEGTRIEAENRRIELLF